MNPRHINYLAFAALMLTTLFGLQFLWGLLFLYWTIPNFYAEQATLVSTVKKADDPILFWAIQIAWIALGIMMIAADFLPLLA